MKRVGAVCVRFNKPPKPDSAEDTAAAQTSMQSMGNMISINYINPDKSKRAGEYARTVYMHMQNAPTLKAGDTVTKCQVVGYIGNTGRSSGPHLHLVLCVENDSFMKPGQTGWVKNNGAPHINPTIYLPDYKA